MKDNPRTFNVEKGNNWESLKKRKQLTGRLCQVYIGEEIECLRYWTKRNCSFALRNYRKVRN